MLISRKVPRKRNLARALFRWLRQGHATQLGNGTMSCNALSGLHAARVIKSRRGARHASRLLGAAAAICLFGVVPIVAGNLAPASAQVHGTQLSGEFRQALQPYGRWERHSRWGEVWLPGNRARGWRPYTEGRWVYSNDWGWYWAEDQDEAAWGWVTYHYGRWVSDADVGWAWIPGDEWGPAFVQWRYGADHVGWAPLPPDEVDRRLPRPSGRVVILSRPRFRRAPADRA